MARSKPNYNRIDDLGRSGSNPTDDAHPSGEYCVIANSLGFTVLRYVVGNPFKVLFVVENLRHALIVTRESALRCPFRGCNFTPCTKTTLHDLMVVLQKII